MDTTLFTPIMVIGTILALIFAAGALWNSLSRRKHLYLAESESEEEERIVFKPMPETPPAEAEAEISSKTSGPKARASRTPTPLFRQVLPSGVVEADETGLDEKELYVWE